MFRGIRCSLLLIVVLFLVLTGAVDAQSQGSNIRDGIDLPAPWGVAITLYSQTQDYKIVSLDVPLAGIDIGQAENLTVANQTSTYHFKFDYWLLPFLNVYAIVGFVDGTTTVELGKIDLGIPIRLNDIRIDYDGLLYGGGVTLAYGGEDWFTSLTYDINKTNLDLTDSSVSAWVLTPRVGLVFEGAAIWVGGMYQQADETHTGVFDMPYLGSVPFRVELEQRDAWSYFVGMNAGLGEHLNLTLEGGFGPRKAALATLEYRF
ncbi:MAG: hypothetical protein ACC742_13545 [Thermoanaerobaculales bacterium]